MEKQELSLNEYQKEAMTTCMPSCSNFSYMFINLVGEIGEFASKVAKHIRKDETVIEWNALLTEKGGKSVSDSEMEDLRKELGDCLWQLSGLCQVMGWRLEDVARENLEKLASRKMRGLIDGNGDNR